ncbi:rab GTPase-binding effector protein 2 isoform X3 [Xenopus tropicalis]|uniref:Rab GTPase-binding effector protein 2 n=1 Tax=Xenopus tropicalis TaxID=8364 RepID=A0A8J1IWI3_XENTR|nr:rab GTPase-binding effector protein 2 isoform X3 [Xenopus tropicalis]
MSQLEDEDSGQEPISPSADFPGEELEVTPVAETFARGFDCVSISSFPGERLIPGKEDTASLVSTATLVPECIYIPPSGYQLVPEQEATLTATFNRLCQEVNCLNEENEKLRALSSATAPGEPRVTVEPSPTQRAVQHRQERLCIEIVSLQEELKLEQREKSLLEGQLRVQQETHTEETQIMEATLSSLRTEMERLQQERKQTELQLQESESQVQKLWESVSEQEKCLLQEKEGKICLQAALSEEKTKVSRLQAELGTSEEVQRDFVRLSQALQVSLEKIRQADSMADVSSILEGTRLTDINQLQET